MVMEIWDLMFFNNICMDKIPFFMIYDLSVKCQQALLFGLVERVSGPDYVELKLLFVFYKNYWKFFDV